jgi:hypothetical protein
MASRTDWHDVHAITDLAVTQITTPPALSGCDCVVPKLITVAIAIALEARTQGLYCLTSSNYCYLLAINVSTKAITNNDKYLFI